MSDLDGLTIGVPSLIVLAVVAILTFATAALSVRASRNLVLAAVAASVVFAVRNAHLGGEMHGEYWGTFPDDQLAAPELLVLYATQAFVFVGASGVVLAGLSRRASWWLVPFLWVGGGLVVMASVFVVSSALSDVFHWSWVAVQHKDAAMHWGIRLGLAYLFIGGIGREWKRAARVEKAGVESSAHAATDEGARPSGSRPVAAASTEGRPMWQRLVLASFFGALVAIMGATLYRSATSADKQEADRKAAQLDYARRLRADGDRLASEERWEDALARYDQAARYDRAGDLDRATQLKRLKMNDHVGEVVFDMDFERRRAAP